MIKTRHPSSATICQRLVNYVVKELDYFRSNPRHLAWAMMNYSIIGYVGREFLNSYINPKDILIDLEGEITKADADLIYDAWGVTISNHQHFPDTNPADPLQSKKNKTVDEWVQVMMSPLYAHHELYKNRYRVLDALFCVNGNGMEWNSDGYICHAGPSGIDEDLFAGYTRCENEIKPKVREKILSYRKSLSDNPLVGEALEIKLSKALDNGRRIHAGEDYFDVLEEGNDRRKLWKSYKKIGFEARKIDDSIAAKLDEMEKERAEQEKKPNFYPMSPNYNNLDNMPDNVPPSYIAAGIEVCELIAASNCLVVSDHEHADAYYKPALKIATEFLKKWKK